MTAQPVTTAHRRGLRTSFLAASHGPRAGWEEVVNAAQNHVDGDAVAGGTRVLTRQWDGDAGRVELHDDAVGDLVEPPVENLMEVRRPLSYQGMKSYIGRMCVPSSDGSGRGVWFESRNEQDNYRDFLICHDVREMATQPLRFEWAFPGGLRTHVPDALVRLADGSVRLLDVTTRKKMADPQLLAVTALTHRTCEALGWSYEVRYELEPQRARNVAMIWACRTAPVEQAQRWAAIAAEMPDGIQVLPAARLLSAGLDTPNLGGVWHLIATGVLAVQLTQRLASDTPLHQGFRAGRGTR